MWLDASFGYGREVLRGVLRYSRSHGPWKLLASLHGSRWPIPWDRLSFDGVIGSLWDPELDRRLQALAKPVVNVSAARSEQPFPAVWSDNMAIGAMAADDLLRRGFRHFGWLSDPAQGWTPDRGRGFIAAVEAAGYACDVFHAQRPDAADDSPLSAYSGMHAWVQSLPKPIGVFCGDEYQAWTFIGTCQDVGVEVPEHVAVIAAGNDDLICEACDVALSGVDMGAERIGYEAAGLLHRLIEGEPLPDKPLLVAPSHVVTRRSSDVLAIEDPTLAAAMRTIHEQACQPLTVKTLLAQLPGVDRRWIERRFRATLGRTVHDEIMRARLDRARQLLIDTDLKLEQVALRCGFPSAQHFGVVFRKNIGQTPAHFRRTTRAR